MTVKKKIVESNIIGTDGKPLKVKVKMATKAKAKYIEAWTEIKATLSGRDIVYGAKAKVSATDDLKEVQDNIFAENLENLNAMLAQLQGK